MSNTTVSVVIPTYNRADLLPETLDSLLAQTRPPDEIIVVDDGSTDHTPDVLARYGEPVSALHQPNQGRSAARNRGMQAASGELITFLDSDDTLPPESLEKRIGYLRDHPAIDAVYCDVTYHQDDEVLGLFSEIRPGPRPSEDVFAELARHNMIGPPAAALMRAACAQPFRTDYEPVEDYDLWLRMAADCRFGYLGEPLARYRVHEGMSTRSESNAMQEAMMRVHANTIQRPAFDALRGTEQARIHCSHGMLFAEYGHMNEARHRFRAAIQAAPLYPGGYMLLAAGLLGRRRFLEALHMRRTLRGDVSWA